MNQLLDVVKERANNSVSGPFSLFFFTINWPILIYATTGNSSAIERFNSIQTYLTNTESCFSKPIFATVAYLITMPLIINLHDYYQKVVELKKMVEIEKKTHAEKSLYSPAFETLKIMTVRVHGLLNHYENNKTSASDNLKKMNKILSAMTTDDPTKINSNYRELKTDTSPLF